MKYHLFFCQINFVCLLFFLCYCNTTTKYILYMCQQLVIRKVLLSFTVSLFSLISSELLGTVFLTALWSHRKMLSTSPMLMCFRTMIESDERSEAPCSLHISQKVRSWLACCSQFCFFTLQNFVASQVKMIYFVSEGHKPGWLAYCFCSTYSVGSSTLGLP